MLALEAAGPGTVAVGGLGFLHRMGDIVDVVDVVDAVDIDLDAGRVLGAVLADLSRCVRSHRTCVAQW